jgi:hypothetical protein
MCDSAAAPVDASSAVDAAPIGNAAAIGNATAVDSTGIISSPAWWIGIVAAGLAIAAGGSVIDPATDHAAAIDGAPPIDPATAVDPAPAIDGSTPVDAAPASHRRHQRTRIGGIDDDRVRLHHRRDSLRWLRNEQRSCRCDCERTEPQKSVHLQLLARADGPFGRVGTPWEPPLPHLTTLYQSIL